MQIFRWFLLAELSLLNQNNVPKNSNFKNEQIFANRSSLAAIQVSLHQAEAASASASAITRDDNQPDEDYDEAMAPSNDSCTPSKGISWQDNPSSTLLRF